MGDIEIFIRDYCKQEYHDYYFHYIFTENRLQTCYTGLTVNECKNVKIADK